MNVNYPLNSDYVSFHAVQKNSITYRSNLKGNPKIHTIILWALYVIAIINLYIMFVLVFKLVVQLPITTKNKLIIKNAKIMPISSVKKDN